MSNKFIWSPTNENFIIGGVFDATLSNPLQDFEVYVSSYWLKLVEVCSDYYDRINNLNILIEIWPDTARIISCLSDRKEFARVCLSMPEFEKEYYRLPEDEAKFESEYDLLFNKVFDVLKNSFVLADFSFITNQEIILNVIVRDSDDKDTEVIIS